MPTGFRHTHPATQRAPSGSPPSIANATSTLLHSETSERSTMPKEQHTEHVSLVSKVHGSTPAKSTTRHHGSQQSAVTTSTSEESQATEAHSIPPSSESISVAQATTVFHTSRRAEDITRPPPSRQTTHVITTQEQSLATVEQSVPDSSQSPTGIETTTVTHTERSEETTSPSIQATERALNASTAHSSTRSESTAHTSRQTAHTGSTQEQSPATEGHLLPSSTAHTLPSSQHTSSGSPSGIKHLTSTSLQQEASEQTTVTATEATEHASKAHTSMATAGTSHPSLSHQSVSTLKESLATDEHAMLSSSESPSVTEATTAHLPKGSEETIATSTSVEKDVTNASIAYVSTHAESTTHPPRSRQTAHISSTQEQSLSTEKHFAPTSSLHTHPATQTASPEIPTTANLRSTTSEQTSAPATKPTEQGPHITQALTGTHTESTTHPPVSQRSAGTVSMPEEGQATEGPSILPSSESPYAQEATTAFHPETSRQAASPTAETTEYTWNASQTYSSKRADAITHPHPSRQTTHVTTTQEQSLATVEQSISASSQPPSGIETTTVTNTEMWDETTSSPTPTAERALSASTAHSSTRAESTAHPSRPAAHTDSTQEQSPATEGPLLRTSLAHTLSSSQRASSGSPSGIKHVTSTSLRPETSEQTPETATKVTEHVSHVSKVPYEHANSRCIAPICVARIG
ncbi:mucin-5AC-like [Pollicipes pollicipes]|uniref:mucin-5AC-like n=1 Tax=Pollicipes pollicipes TaxID=41117 RepID=UPI0018858929|nr:mucin-5AC-like [Pollicipes pollicipes]